MTNYRVGVDIGGASTDVVFLSSDGQILARKVASTPDDYSQAVLEGVSKTELTTTTGQRRRGKLLSLGGKDG